MKLIVRTLVKEKIYEEKLKNTEKIKGTFSLEYFNVYPGFDDTFKDKVDCKIFWHFCQNKQTVRE